MEPIELREFRNRIGRAIRNLRKEEQISAKFLARVLGVTQPTISRIELGITSIPAEKLCFLAKSFNRPLSYFIGEQSSIHFDHTDILRAGLVYYGASHLKSKRTINILDYYKTYETFLQDALMEVDDNRFAAALTTTLFCRALKNQLKSNRIVATIQNDRSVANLQAILLGLINNFYISSQIKKGKHVQESLRELFEDLEKSYGNKTAQALVARNDDLYVVNFIKQSLGYA